MKKLTDYIIPIRGLKEGKYEFNYTLTPSFFDAFEEDEIRCKTIDVLVKLNKNNNIFEFSFEIHGIIIVACDRCLDNLELSIEHSAMMFVKYGQDFQELDDDVLIIPENEGTFDVSSLILEFVKLSIPIKKVHSDGQCNVDMMQRIDELTPHEEEKTDPRWDTLKDLL